MVRRRSGWPALSYCLFRLKTVKTRCEWLVSYIQCQLDMGAECDGYINSERASNLHHNFESETSRPSNQASNTMVIENATAAWLCTLSNDEYHQGV